MDIEITELLQKIVDEVPLGIYVLDTERKIVFWSTGAERITGYSQEEMVGRHCFEGMLDHIDREGVHLCHDFCPMMATIFDGQSREQPVFLKDRIGQRIPVMVHTEPLFKGQETLGAYEAAKTQYDKTCEAIQYRKARSLQMDSFIKELREQELIKEFDARLWSCLVDFITVYSKDDIRGTFKNGIEY